MHFCCLIFIPAKFQENRWHRIFSSGTLGVFCPITDIRICIYDKIPYYTQEFSGNWTNSFMVIVLIFLSHKEIFFFMKFFFSRFLCHVTQNDVRSVCVCVCVRACVYVCVCVLKLRKIQASVSQESFGRWS